VLSAERNVRNDVEWSGCTCACCMCKRLNPLKRGLIEPICILLGGARAKALYRQPAGHSLGEDAPR
jgi:hypothetical protein